MKNKSGRKPKKEELRYEDLIKALRRDQKAEKTINQFLKRFKNDANSRILNAKQILLKLEIDLKNSLINELNVINSKLKKLNNLESSKEIIDTKSHNSRDACGQLLEKITLARRCLSELQEQIDSMPYTIHKLSKYKIQNQSYEYFRLSASREDNLAKYIQNVMKSIKTNISTIEKLLNDDKKDITYSSNDLIVVENENSEFVEPFVDITSTRTGEFKPSDLPRANELNNISKSSITEINSNTNKEVTVRNTPSLIETQTRSTLSLFGQTVETPDDTYSVEVKDEHQFNNSLKSVNVNKNGNKKKILNIEYTTSNEEFTKISRQEILPSKLDYQNNSHLLNHETLDDFNFDDLMDDSENDTSAKENSINTKDGLGDLVNSFSMDPDKHIQECATFFNNMM